MVSIVILVTPKVEFMDGYAGVITAIGEAARGSGWSVVVLLGGGHL